ncbi:MAG: hypothetical protein II797_04825 [Clostridia bacterium]|nr:hypothetical protein [Clostridia bacterium]
MAGKSEKKRIGAVGWCLIVAAVLALFGVAWRLNLPSFFVPKAQPAQEEYLVTFRISDIRTTSGDFLGSGEVFYLPDNSVFGTITGAVSMTPAEKYVENENGTIGLVYDNGEGDSARIDVTGTFLVRASVNEDKALIMIGGTEYIAPNKYFTIHSSRYECTILVTDVTKK